MRYFCIAFLSFLSCHTAAWAQDEIETDRPSVTETTSIVPVNHFQMESGFEHRQDNAGAYSLAAPSVLWKYGLVKSLELRLVTDIAYEETPRETAQGLQPVTVGCKAKLWEEKNIIPETALLAQVQLPKVASKDFEAMHLAPQIKLLFSNTLSNTLNVGYNVGTEWDGDTGSPVYQYTVTPGFKLSNKLNAFVEAFGYLPPHQRPDHWVDGGIMFLITKKVQVDVAGGYELSAHNHFHSFYETVGVSFRI